MHQEVISTSSFEFKVNDALKAVSRMNRRIVSSPLEKLIDDYLTKQG
jgi:hypothetical protein